MQKPEHFYVRAERLELAHIDPLQLQFLARRFVVPELLSKAFPSLDADVVSRIVEGTMQMVKTGNTWGIVPVVKQAPIREKTKVVNVPTIKGT